MRTNFLGQTDRQTDGQTEKFNTISLRFTGDKDTIRHMVIDLIFIEHTNNKKV